MARPAQDVTDAELAVLEVLWDRGAVTRRQIAEVLYPDGAPAHYTTVQKLLERLEAKGHVARGRGEGTLTFTAATDREQLISRRLLDVADKLCGGSLTPLLLHLLRAEQLNANERQELRSFLDQLKKSSRPAKGTDR